MFIQTLLEIDLTTAGDEHRLERMIFYRVNFRGSRHETQTAGRILSILKT
jgi:hypothetical protein